MDEDITRMDHVDFRWDHASDVEHRKLVGEPWIRHEGSKVVCHQRCGNVTTSAGQEISRTYGLDGSLNLTLLRSGAIQEVEMASYMSSKMPMYSTPVRLTAGIQVMSPQGTSRNVRTPSSSKTLRRKCRTWPRTAIYSLSYRPEFLSLGNGFGVGHNHHHVCHLEADGETLPIAARRH